MFMTALDTQRTQRVGKYIYRTHGVRISCKSLNFGLSFVCKWTKSFQLRPWALPASLPCYRGFASTLRPPHSPLASCHIPPTPQIPYPSLYSGRLTSKYNTGIISKFSRSTPVRRPPPRRKFVQTSYAVKSQLIGHIFFADS